MMRFNKINRSNFFFTYLVSFILLLVVSQPPPNEVHMNNLNNSLTIEYISIDKITPYERQLRKHDKKQMAKAEKLVTKFGQASPLIIDFENTIIDGTLIFNTLKKLGHTEVAVVRSLSHDLEDIRALRMALNRLSEDSEWNVPEMAIEFNELFELDIDISFTGFEEQEIEGIVFGVSENSDPEANPLDDIKLDETPISQLGDKWAFRDHILVCGDSTDASTFKYLMDDQLARMVLTDCPYNLSIQRHISANGVNKHPEFAMASGEMTSDQFQEFIETFMRNCSDFSVDGSLHYLFIDWGHLFEMLSAGRKVYEELKALVFWNKDNGGQGSFYRSKHEIVPVFKKGKAKHINNIMMGKNSRNRNNVWDYPGVNTFSNDRMSDLAMHPTVKNTAMLMDAILDVTNKGDIILDCFAGSGSTLIAAERTERIARLIEIEPHYVDVIIHRWQNETELEAIHVETGKTFEEVRRERHVFS